jgi:hypothetical protein
MLTAVTVTHLTRTRFLYKSTASGAPPPATSRSRRRDSDVTFVYPLDHGDQVSGVLNEVCLKQGGIAGGGDVLGPRERVIERPADRLVPSQYSLP